MLTTIINSIMPSQKISVYNASGSELIYEGTIYIYITEKEV